MALRSKGNFSVKKRVGEVKLTNAAGKDVFFSNDMVDPVIAAVKEAKAIKKTFPGMAWEYEVKLEPLPDMPDLWGTVDMLGVDIAKNHVVVIDFKFGRQKVSSINNPQLMTYALLAAFPER